MSSWRKYLWLSQATLLITLLICSLIIPSVAIHEGGVSNFGNHLSTVALYSLGFLGNAIFIYLASNEIKNLSPNLQRESIWLKVLSLLTLLVFISTFPRHYSFTFSDIHDYLGTILFSFYLFISIETLIKNFKPLTFLFVAVQVAGSVISLLSILRFIDMLYVGQLVGSIGFSLVIVISFPKVIDRKLRSERH